MAPRKMVAVKDPTGLDLLGRLAMYTLPDEPVRGTKLVKVWAAAGLNVDTLPAQRNGTDVFRSACRSVETRKGAGQVEVKVDEVLHDATECVYQITRIVRDTTQRQIDHPKAMTLRYDKSMDEITVERELEEYEHLRGLEEAIRKHFNRYAKSIPGQKVRNAIRDTLLDLGAQNLRRKAGGIYFVPDKDAKGKPTLPILKGLETALGELYATNGDFHTIPLVSDKGAKEMVAKHFAINVNEKSRDLMERALNRARTGKATRAVRSDLMANLYNERRQIAASVEQFSQLVKLEMGDIEKNMADLDNALAQLQDLADAA